MTKKKEKKEKKEKKVIGKNVKKAAASSVKLLPKKPEKKKSNEKKQSQAVLKAEKNIRKSVKKEEKRTLLLFCPRCKRETDNVITGFIGQKIRRVRCEVCKSEYNYHRIQALKKRMEEEKNIEPEHGQEQHIQQNYYRLWEDLMLGRDPQTARTYNIKDKYFENDLLNHPVFGVGVVRSVMEDYKIEVVFKNSIKILAHNRFLSKK